MPQLWLKVTSRGKEKLHPVMSSLVTLVKTAKGDGGGRLVTCDESR